VGVVEEGNKLTTEVDLLLCGTYRYSKVYVGAEASPTRRQIVKNEHRCIGLLKYKLNATNLFEKGCT